MEKPKRTAPKLLKLAKPGCWVYENELGDVVVYNRERKPLNVERVNFLLDRAKIKLLE